LPAPPRRCAPPAPSPPGIRPPSGACSRCSMSQPIRVLHLLVTTSPGGGPKHVYDLVRHLPGNQVEVVVAAPRDGIFFDRFRDLGLTMVELPLSRLGVRHLLLAMGLIRKYGVDIVHTHGKGPGL